MAMRTNVVDGKLVITIDIDDEAKRKAPLSKSGKSHLVASTGGFVHIADAGVKLALNVTC